jgi:hypothetical protein
VPRNLCAGAGCAGRDIVLYKCSKSWPSVFASNEFQGAVLSEMTGEGMIMLILEDSELEDIGVWYVDMTI